MNLAVNTRTLVLGGSRSGKSRYAERLLGDGPVRYVATGRRVPGDAEWDARIAAHRDRRPASWTTAEITAGPELAAALAVPGPVLVDDVATWLTGVLDDAGAWSATGPLPDVDDAVAALVEAVRTAPGPVVLVSAETGLGVVPETASGRLFRDRLGELNEALAGVCDDVVLVVAGRAVRLPAPESPVDAATGSGSVADPTPPAVAGAPVAGTAASDPPAPVEESAGAADVATADGNVAGTPAVVPGSVTPETGVDAAPISGVTPSAEPAGPVVPTAVGAPDRHSRRAAVALVEDLATPAGGLGRLGELGVWLASCQGECPPRPPVQARVLLLAADHGVAATGVSAYPQEVSAVRASAAAAGRLPVTVAARAAGASVRTVDVGLVTGADGAESGHVVVRGTGMIDVEDALTAAQAETAWRTGRTLADEEIDAGADVLVPATLAVGATTPSATLVAALTGTEPVAVVGRASGIDDRAWMRKAVVIRDALRRARPHLRDPLALLRTVGGTDLVVLAGFLARAAERKVPVVLDGLAVGTAALLAEELAPGAKQWWVAAQPSTEPAATLVLEHLALTPVLDLAVRTEDGTAGVAVLPLLVTAARLIAETGSADETGIVRRGPSVPAGAGR
ncbi:bifunctional adenosylcobinamide kinase/adenosylcobinamide-phosphate guanylyltransferase [Pseudonocardia nematodicida]|uniref:Nicotinate-nucleotide--dimethylbenzimidazole phosphoribosyltransferase n=1 Tax=Pseudonocardia nematodicida TaxID=1206997 RepID=A0ABV1K9H2_9PSEU